MIAPVVGEKNFPLRIPPDLYERVRQIGGEHERSANWVMVRLLRKAARESPEWIKDALDTLAT